MNVSFIKISRTCVKSQADPGLQLQKALIKPSALLQSVDVLYQGSSAQELLVMEALFIADRKPPLNSQEEGRDSVKYILICSVGKYLLFQYLCP